MKDKIVIVLALILLCSGVYLIAQSYNVPYDQEIEYGNIESCPNFNGKDFLLTGGSVKATGIEDSKVEMNRLSWLCRGGSNQ